MDKYTASNGLMFTRASDGSWRWEAGYAPSRVTTALRELFRAERDEELGRWRWPENLDYVVYPVIYPAHEMAFGQNLSVMVFHEPTGVLKGYCREEDQGGDLTREYPGAARAYFDAHPVRKPWEDAKHGEVWVVTVGEGLEFVARVEFDGPPFPRFIDLSDGMSYGPKAGIVDARRIWPESD